MLKILIFPPKNFEKIRAPKIRMRQLFKKILKDQVNYFHPQVLFLFIVNRCNTLIKAEVPL